MANFYRSVPKPGRIIKAQPSKPLKPYIRTQKLAKPVRPVQPIRPQRIISKPKTVIGQNQNQNQNQHALKPRTVIGLKKQSVSRDKKVQTVGQNRPQQVQSTKSLHPLDQYNASINRTRNIGSGKILIIVANGPSINEVDLHLLVGHPKIDIMCINKPDMRVWPSKYWAFCDQSQYNRNMELFDSYSGLLVNSPAVKARKSNQIIIRSISGTGFSKDLTRGFYIARSTVYANMQTALWMGYDNIFIFGIDMCLVDGKAHFYGQNPDVKTDERVRRFSKEAENYAKAYSILSPEERSKFRICSSYNPWSFADMFGRLDHKIAIPEILKLANTKG